jgi:hypothetical protein
MAGSVDMRPKLVVVANYGSTENRPPYVSDGRDEGKRSSGPGASKPSEEMLRSTLTDLNLLPELLVRYIRHGTATHLTGCS